MLSGDKIGFLMLTVLPTVYANLSANPFEKPPNPNTVPKIPPNATGIEQTAIR